MLFIHHQVAPYCINLNFCFLEIQLNQIFYKRSFWPHQFAIHLLHYPFEMFNIVFNSRIFYQVVKTFLCPYCLQQKILIIFFFDNLFPLSSIPYRYFSARSSRLLPSFHQNFLNAKDLMSYLVIKLLCSVAIPF